MKKLQIIIPKNSKIKKGSLLEFNNFKLIALPINNPVRKDRSVISNIPSFLINILNILNPLISFQILYFLFITLQVTRISLYRAKYN